MAEDKVNVPAGVSTASGSEDLRQKEHEQPVAQYIARNQSGVDKYAPFGVSTHQQLTELVKSNANLAAQVVDAYIAGDILTEKGVAGAGIVQNPNAPQEGNITGDLDRTGDVATKLHHDGESPAEVPSMGSSNKVN